MMEEPDTDNNKPGFLYKMEMGISSNSKPIWTSASPWTSLAHSENDTAANDILLETKTIDCLICGWKNICSQMSVKEEEEYNWAKAFCEMFTLNSPDFVSLLCCSYYCNVCQLNLRSITKLKMELNKLKMCCHNLMRKAYLRSRMGTTNLQNDDQQESPSQNKKRDRICQHLNGIKNIGEVCTSSLEDDIDTDNKIQLSATRFQSNATNEFHKNPPSFSTAISYSYPCVSTIMEDCQSSMNQTSQSSLSLEEVSPLESDNDIANADDVDSDFVLDKADEAADVTDNASDDDIFSNGPLLSSSKPKPKTKPSLFMQMPEIQSLAQNMQSIATSTLKGSENPKSTRAKPKPGRFRTTAALGTVMDGSDLNKTSNLSKISSATYSSGISTSTDSESSESETVTSSKSKFRKRKFSKYPSLTRAETANNRPTVFSDRNNGDNIVLQEKYKDLIAALGVKDVVIPVGRIPNFEDTDDESEGRRRQCPIIDCTTVFYKKFKLVEHIKKVHQGMKYPYECIVCHRKFGRRHDFIDHANTHSGVKPYECEYCHTKFSMIKSLKGHINNIHGEKKFQCDQCGKCYHSKFPYELHVQAHSGERPCTCEICGKSFKQMYDLRIHQRLHPEFNLDPLKCDICNKVFSSSYGLKIHTKVRHTGDLPFQCDLCDYRAPYLGRLNIHKLSQHGTRDFECDVCHRKYKSELMLSHHKKHWCLKEPKGLTCGECGKGFKNNITLHRHEKIHQGTRKNFLCSACGKDFSSKSNLQRHFLHSHTEHQNDCVDNSSADTSSTSTVPNEMDVEPGPSWTNAFNFYNDIV